MNIKQNRTNTRQNKNSSEKWAKWRPNFPKPKPEKWKNEKK